MGWYDDVKSYVWDDRTTPYLVPVRRLSQPQADRELFAYILFLLLSFSVVGLAVLAQAKLRNDPLFLLAALHAFSIVGCALYLGYSKNVAVARYCMSAPVMACVGFATGVLNPNLHLVEWLLLCGFTLLWFRYSMRVVAIARAYPDMSETLPDDLPPLPANLRRRGGKQPPKPKS